MVKKEFNENEINVEDYIQQKENKKTGRSKKLTIGLTATVTALAVAASAMTISFAAPEAQTASLTLSGEDESHGIVLEDVSDIVDEVLPSVVSITSRSLINYYGNSNGGYFDDGFGDIFDYFFGDSFGGRGNEYFYREEIPQRESAEEDTDKENTDENAEEAPEEIDSGMGSGTIIAKTDDELLILTSYHVVEGSSSLYVTFIDDSSVDGTIKSADADKDIAIVSVPLADIDEETLSKIKVATISTQEPEVGEGVIVIGNALGYGISVTTGIVSATERDIYVEDKTLTVIQTDAAINSGNSGGCMLNANGEIIGINEAKVKMTFVEGMCYAIPVYSNVDLIEELLNSDEIITDEVTPGTGAFLGIRGRDVTSSISNDFGMPEGIYVSETVKGSGANEAGLLGGDIIVGVDDEEISTMAELQSILAGHSAGDEIVLKIMRNTEGEYVSMDITVVLTDWIS